MEISTFWLYVILQLDALLGVLGAFLALLGLITFGLVFAWMVEEDVRIFCQKSLRATLPAFAVLLLLNVAIPTTRTAATLVILLAIAKSDTLAKLGDTGNALLDLANQWAKEKVKEERE